MQQQQEEEQQQHLLCFGDFAVSQQVWNTQGCCCLQVKKVPSMHDRGSILHAFKRYLFLEPAVQQDALPQALPREKQRKNTPNTLLVAANNAV